MTETDETTPTAAVADAILQLTYGELMEIAVQLRDMNTDGSYDLTERSGWAEMLHHWAEGQEG